MKVGLALAGGGAKAAAHIGVLKAIEEEKIKIDYIAGTSSGSIIATLYAIGYNSDEIMKIFKKYCKKIKYIEFINIIKLIIGLLIKNKIVISGFNNGKKLEKLIKQYCEEKNITNINKIKMPLIIPTVNLNNGELDVFSSVKIGEYRNWISDDIVYINEGEIEKIVRASCAYPGIFYPAELKNRKLIDGGVRENIPWKELKEIGAEKVIASCFEEKLDEKCCNNFIEIISRSLSFSNHELSNYELEGVDYLIKTKMDNIGLLDSSKTDELYKEGYETAKKELKKIIK